MMAPSLLVALPMYNEQAYAEKCVTGILAALDELQLPSAVVAINDGSRDETLSILNRLQPRFPRLHVLNHPGNRGYGSTIRSAYGFAAAEGFDYVLFMDGDLTQDPRYIADFVPHMLRGVDCIKASRYIRGSRVLGVPRARILVSSIGNWIARLSFGLPITDYTNGFRAFRTAVAEQFRLHEDRFAILVEEMWQAKYFASTFAEVRYTLGARPNPGDSKFRYDLGAYRDYLKYCLLSIRGARPAGVS